MEPGYKSSIKDRLSFHEHPKKKQFSMCGQNENDPVAEWFRIKLLKDKERQILAVKERKTKEKEEMERKWRAEMAQQAFNYWIVKKRREAEQQMREATPDTTEAEAEYRAEVSRERVALWLERKTRARAVADFGLLAEMEACRLWQERAWQQAFSVGIYMRSGDCTSTVLGRLRRLRRRRLQPKRRQTNFRKDSISSGFVYLTASNLPVTARSTVGSRELFKNFVS